jgi:hypothetical protein
LIYRQIGPQTSHDIFVLPTSSGRKPFPYLQTPAMENGGAFSPDGRWIAYASDESGRVEVYLESFPTHGGKRQISPGGGGGPRWRGDGKELYYYSLDGNLMAVSVTNGGETLATDTPTALFSFRPAAAPTVPSYTATHDGQRFLLSAIVGTPGRHCLSCRTGQRESGDSVRHLATVMCCSASPMRAKQQPHGRGVMIGDALSEMCQMRVSTPLEYGQLWTHIAERQ